MSKHGNNAIMREALRTLRQRFDNDVTAYQDRYLKFSGWHWHKKAAEAAKWRDVFYELREACDSALSDPSRNCDRFADELDAQLAFLNEEWLISVDRDSMLESDRFENWTDEMRSAYAKWLMAKTEGDDHAKNY